MKSLEEGSSELEALEERVTACESATWLSTKVDQLAEPLFIECMNQLANYVHEFPTKVATGVLCRLYKGKFLSLMRAPDLSDAAFDEALRTLLQTFDFWSLDAGENCDEEDLVDLDAPSFRPLYKRVKQDLDAVGGSAQDGEDEGDEAWEMLMQKRRKLERRASNESEPASEAGGGNASTSPTAEADLQACSCETKPCWLRQSRVE